MKEDYNKASDSNKINKNIIYIKRGFAALLAGCVLACSLAACGGDDKDKSSSSSAGDGPSSTIVTPSPTPLPTAKAVRITGDIVNVRKSGSTDSDILGIVEQGDELALLTEAAQNNWYQVSYEGSPAYVSADYADVIDVTVEKYNALKAAVSPTATPTADPSSGADSSSAPESSGASSTPASSDSSGDNQDGE